MRSYKTYSHSYQGFLFWVNRFRSKVTIISFTFRSEAFTTLRDLINVPLLRLCKTFATSGYNLYKQVASSTLMLRLNEPLWKTICCGKITLFGFGLFGMHFSQLTVHCWLWIVSIQKIPLLFGFCRWHFCQIIYLRAPLTTPLTENGKP